MVGPRPFLVKLSKGDCDRKCFQDNKNFETAIYRIKFWNSYLQNFIHFLFGKFQLVLIGRFGDMVT